MKNSKDAYYFPHDSNAKDDPKCMLLIDQLGLEGYGIFWVLIEVLRDQPDYTYPLANLPALARRYNCTAEKFQTVVSNYRLFCIENEQVFFSNSLRRRMAIVDERRALLSSYGQMGAETRWGKKNSHPIAALSQGHSHPIAIKEKKRKEKERECTKRRAFVPPTLKDVQAFFRENGYSESKAEEAYRYYEEGNWNDAKGQPVKNWKQKMRGVWFKDENRATTPKPSTNDKAKPRHCFNESK